MEIIGIGCFVSAQWRCPASCLSSLPFSLLPMANFQHVYSIKHGDILSIHIGASKDGPFPQTGHVMKKTTLKHWALTVFGPPHDHTIWSSGTSATFQNNHPKRAGDQAPPAATRPATKTFQEQWPDMARPLHLFQQQIATAKQHDLHFMIHPQAPII